MDESSSVTIPKSPEATVYIFNMSEDVWPFISAMSDAQARAKEIAENEDLGDHTFFGFAQEDNVLYIGSRAMSDEFLSYFTSLFGNKNIRTRRTKVHTGVICDDILRDEGLMDEIIQAANGVKKLNLVSYTTSQPFLRLADELRKRGLTVMTTESPEEEHAWTVNFFGSKSGIRQLAQKSLAKEPDFVMADGLIVMGPDDAARIAATKYIKEDGVVIKTNKGHAGMGVLIFRPGDLPKEFRACEDAILAIFKKDKYWNMFPIIIESLIAVTESVGGGAPNVEFKITKAGRIECLFYGGMRVSKEGVYQGMEIGNDSLNDRISTQLMDTGYFIAEQYRAAGYRGYFDVDFVASRNGTLYVTESNVRRTACTHAYHVAAKLFGKDFLYDTYMLCHSSYRIPGEKQLTFSKVKTILEPILFDPVKKEGIIITSENSIHNRHVLEYIIFGSTKKRAFELEVQMETLLRA